MNKRITSLLLSFVMIFAMFATAAPVSAEPATSTFTFTVEADKTTAGPGDAKARKAKNKPTLSEKGGNLWLINVLSVVRTSI